ncbi:hypothetical protein GQ457_06G008470 [Hibiscus cannabinus]
MSGSRLWKALSVIWCDVRNFVRTRVGDGMTTKFWRDSWIVGIDPLIAYVPERLVPSLEYVSVAAMTDAAGCPMVGFAADAECWKGTVQGNFTVKSAYIIRCGPTIPDDGKLWKTLNKYRGLQRIKIFLWLVCLERVMTNSERVRRHISDNAGCSLCGALIEDVNHLLRWCPQAIGIWTSLIKPDFLHQFLTMNIKEWVYLNLTDAAQMANHPEDWDLLFGSICWNLWLERNAVVFDNPLDDRGTVLERSRRLQQQYLLASSSAAPSRTWERRNGAAGSSNNDVQRLLAEGWFQANADAGCRLADGSAKCGGVIRSHDGRWVQGVAKFIGICSVLEAELWGAFTILHAAWGLGITRIVIELDCLEAVCMIKLASLPPRSPTILFHLRELLSRPWCVEVFHIDSEKNRLAHDLAKLASGPSLCPIYFLYPPVPNYYSEYAITIG